MNADPRAELARLFSAGVAAVQGEAAVAKALANTAPIRFPAVLALGKAAASMYLGAHPGLSSGHRALIVTKHGHATDPRLAGQTVEIIESSHPIPNADSLNAGRRCLKFVLECTTETDLLVLVSGGASALVEDLVEGVDLAELRRITDELVASGADIATINAKRKSLSRVKGGRLLAAFPGKSIHALAISDVQGDDIGTIGSGIGACANPTIPYRCEIVASNAVARSAIARLAEDHGLRVIRNEEILYGDVSDAADRIVAACTDGPNGLYVFGGEPTVKLPHSPGEGGRNQALALLVAKRIADRDDLICLVAGTDGTDGPTEAAGAIVDGKSFHKQPGADEALARADAGRFLRETGDRLVTGPTGTNVMDLAIVRKLSPNP
ncbi:MAG: DUF4147 domain-containing protein [Rhizobiaceae bacterium]|nr:DUF4147 domain-containing protein [Rhizobiaceae bacterium]